MAFFDGIVQEIYSPAVKKPPEDFLDAVRGLRADGYIQAKAFKWSDFASRLNDVYKNVADYKLDLVRSGTFVAPSVLPTFPDMAYVPDFNKIERQNAVNAARDFALKNPQQAIILTAALAVGMWFLWRKVK
jgi:hypothetical protein